MKVGLVAGSFKPYTAGHDALIRLAARECDVVHVFASLSNRARKGEVPVLGSDMALVWKDAIEPTLPSNVEVTYEGSPVGNVFKELGRASEERSDDTYVVYGDPADLTQNFPENLLDKYSGNLWRAGQIKLRAVERSTTVDVSGTKMRQFLASGDKDAFIKMLPKSIDGDRVWGILRATAKSPPKVKTTAGPTRKRKDEALLRQLVGEVVSSLVGQGRTSH